MSRLPTGDQPCGRERQQADDHYPLPQPPAARQQQRDAYNADENNKIGGQCEEAENLGEREEHRGQRLVDEKRAKPSARSLQAGHSPQP